MENVQSKRLVLLVDDDPIALRIYRDGLVRLGFEVKTASDGLSALQALRAGKPDVIVLDLMMPRFSGVEVLRFIRGEKELQALPVIVLSNAYMDPLAQDAAALQAQKGLLKIKCNPASLAAAIHEILSGQPASHGPDHLLGASAAAPPASKTSAPAAAPASRSGSTPLGEPAHSDSKSQARRELTGNAEGICRSLQQLLQAFQSTSAGKERALRAQDLYRKIHFLAAIAGVAEHDALAQMASALEALLFNLTEPPPKPEAPVGRTISAAVEFLQQLLTRGPAPARGVAPPPLVLVVDDDRLSNRLVLSALRNAQLQARGTESPEIALQWLKEQHYDLVLLDIEMPGTNGIELCRRLRGMPGYETTPVIYVTLHSDSETRARTAASGANDLIAKPIQPAELAVKAVMHLLKSRAGN